MRKSLLNLYDDVSILARECINEYLQELRTWGKILTFEEINELQADNKDTTERCEDKKSEDIKDTDAASKRTSSPDEENDSISNSEPEDQKVYSNNKQDSDDIDKEITVSNEFLEWFYSLPEEIKGYLLKSLHIQELIDRSEQKQNFLSIKSVVDLFSKTFSFNIEELHKTIWSNNCNYTQEVEINKKTNCSIEAEFYIPPNFDSIIISDIQVVLPSININLEPHFLDFNNYMDMELKII